MRKDSHMFTCCAFLNKDANMYTLGQQFISEAQKALFLKNIFVCNTGI
jgi:hypothetical protein